MAKRQAEHEEQRSCVCRVADVRVETVCDELVVGMDCEIEGEHFAEGAEAVEPDVGPEENGEDADDEEGGEADCALGREADEGSGERDRRGEG